MLNRYLFSIALAAASLLCGFSRAATFVETSDAGELRGTAQYTGAANPLEFIQGTMLNFPGIHDIPGMDDIPPIRDRDVFAIDIFDPDHFYASTVNDFTVGVAQEFDTKLFLFDGNGNPVFSNDDDPTDDHFRSTIAAGSLLGKAPGLYFIAIAEFGDTPVDGDGNELFAFDGTPLSGAGAFQGWINDQSATDPSGGQYQIDLRGARGATITQTVPEPATLTMFSALLSLVAMQFQLRRRPE